MLCRLTPRVSCEQSAVHFVSRARSARELDPLVSHDSQLPSQTKLPRNLYQRKFRRRWQGRVADRRSSQPSAETLVATAVHVSQHNELSLQAISNHRPKAPDSPFLYQEFRIRIDNARVPDILRPLARCVDNSLLARLGLLGQVPQRLLAGTPPTQKSIQHKRAFDFQPTTHSAELSRNRSLAVASWLTVELNAASAVVRVVLIFHACAPVKCRHRQLLSRCTYANAREMASRVEIPGTFFYRSADARFSRDRLEPFVRSTVCVSASRRSC